MIWINLIAFQVCWAACVWGGATQRWWLGPVVVGMFLAWELFHSASRAKVLKLVAISALLGFLVDSAYIHAGLMKYSSPVPWGQWAPVWIVAMWVAFTLTLNESLAWLKNRPLASVLLGAIGGPLAYWVAVATWDAAEFTATTALVLGVIGAVWALATPALLWLADHLDPRSPGAESA